MSDLATTPLPATPAAPVTAPVVAAPAPIVAPAAPVQSPPATLVGSKPYVPFRDETPTQSELVYSSNPERIAENFAYRGGEYVDRIADYVGLNGEGRSRLLVDVATAFDDAKIMGDAAASIVSVIASRHASPPDEATKRAEAAETNRLLRERFHGDQALIDRRLETVNRFLEARPTFKKMIEHSGMRNHPDLVMKLVEQAHRLRLTPMPKPVAPKTILGGK